MIDFWFLVTTNARLSYSRRLRWPVVPKIGEKFISEKADAVVTVTGVTHVLTNTGQSRILVAGHLPGEKTDVLTREMGFRLDTVEH